MNLEKYKKTLYNKGEIYLRIKVNPNSPQNIVRNILEDDTIKIDISAPPEKNKANKELTKFLGEIFNATKNQITILSGKNERLKLIKIKL